MKSLFKRTLAAASSSILVLSQLSAVAANLNISAADEPAAASSSVTTIDKEFVLYVPIDKEEPMNGLHSDWNDKLETALLGSADKTFTSDLERAKKEAKKVMLKSDRIDSATADELLAAVSEATVKATSDGKATAEIEISDIGQTIGALIEQEMRIQNDGVEGTVGGKPVKADWTKFIVKGKAIVDAEMDYDAKKVNYQITFIDEKGTKYTDYTGVEAYALEKVDEAAALLKEAAAKNGGNTAKFNNKLDKYVAKAKSGESYIKKMIEAVAKISVTASDLDTLYTDYTAKLVDAAKSIEAPEYYTNKAINTFNDKKPATVSQFWTDERVQGDPGDPGRKARKFLF